jgi:hypothetical protein
MTVGSLDEIGSVIIEENRCVALGDGSVCGMVVAGVVSQVVRLEQAREMRYPAPAIAAPQSKPFTVFWTNTEDVNGWEGRSAKSSVRLMVLVGA